MSVRPYASVLWAGVVLVPPLRAAVAAAGAFLWRDAAVFESVASISPRWVPFTVTVAAGWGLTVGVLRFAVTETEGLEARLRPRGGPAFLGIGLFVTFGWLVAGAAAGTLTYPQLLAAALVPAGLVGAAGVEKEVEAPEPLPLPDPPAPLPEEAEAGEGGDAEDETHYHRAFDWLYEEEPYRVGGPTHRFRLRVSVPKEVYDGAVERDHSVASDADYVRFADAGLDEAVVGRVAGRLRAIGRERGLDRMGEIHLAMAFALSMPYASDEEAYGGEYPKYPVETLVDKEGDCEDFSILCAAILHRLGHRVALVLMDIAAQEGGHAALGVVPPEPIEGARLWCDAFGRDVFYCEVTPIPGATTDRTTEGQWWIGIQPPQEATDFQVHPVGMR